MYNIQGAYDNSRHINYIELENIDDSDMHQYSIVDLPYDILVRIAILTKSSSLLKITHDIYSQTKFIDLRVSTYHRHSKLIYIKEVLFNIWINEKSKSIDDVMNAEYKRLAIKARDKGAIHGDIIIIRSIIPSVMLRTYLREIEGAYMYVNINGPYILKIYTTPSELSISKSSGMIGCEFYGETDTIDVHEQPCIFPLNYWDEAFNHIINIRGQKDIFSTQRNDAHFNFCIKWYINDLCKYLIDDHSKIEIKYGDQILETYNVYFHYIAPKDIRTFLMHHTLLKYEVLRDRSNTKDVIRIHYQGKL